LAGKKSLEVESLQPYHLGVTLDVGHRPSANDHLPSVIDHRPSFLSTISILL
jgi:hypothetical protein